MQRNKLYIIVDHTLDTVYGCVQGGHAVAQWLLDNPNPLWKNDYLVYVKADVEQLKDRLDNRAIPYSAFTEPDLDDKLTAIAVHGEHSFLKKLRLIQ